MICPMAYRGAVATVLLLLTACGETDRYEISKDPSGKTVRLDKKTGEIAVIEGDEVKILKNPEVAQKEKEKQKGLAKPRYWPAVENSNLHVRFTLRTSWIEGEMYYELTLHHLERTRAEWQEFLADTEEDKKKAAAALSTIPPSKVSAQLIKAASHTPFTVKLFDENSTMLKDIKITRLTRIVDDKGLAQSFSRESSVPMSAELYTHLKTFSVQWSSW